MIFGELSSWAEELKSPQNPPNHRVGVTGRNMFFFLNLKLPKTEPGDSWFVARDPKPQQTLGSFCGMISGVVCYVCLWSFKNKVDSNPDLRFSAYESSGHLVAGCYPVV